jgi:hypothetical protein
MPPFLRLLANLRAPSKNYLLSDLFAKHPEGGSSNVVSIATKQLDHRAPDQPDTAAEKAHCENAGHSA